MLRNWVSAPQKKIFFHPSTVGLAILREKNITVNCVAEAVQEVTSRGGGAGQLAKTQGLAVACEGGSCRGALRTGGSGVIKGGGLRFPDTN